MDENDKARVPEKSAAGSRDLREQSYGRGHGDWPDPLVEPGELTQDELSLFTSTEVVYGVTGPDVTG